jgi:hypothetical protein
MTVIVNKKVTVMGKTFQAPHYFPGDVPPTHIEREKAESLDKLLKLKIEQINHEYKKTKKSQRIDDIEKWRWLGARLDNLLTQTNEIERKDIDSHIIWPAISQYLEPELRRDDDEKRSGTAKDHLRKCILLFRSKGTKWIKNWAGWDALVDRGEQLGTDDRLLQALEKIFLKHIKKLDSRDYQIIFRLVASKIPSASGKKELALMNVRELNRIAGEVEKEWLKESQSYTEATT